MFWEVYALDRQEYLKSLTEQIRTKRARTMVAEEVEAHIEDQKQDFMAHGLGEEEAESMAVVEMGDPVEAGVKLDRVHRPKMEWTVLMAILVISIMGLILQAVLTSSFPTMNMSTLEAFKDNFLYGGIWSAMLIGIAVMLGICYLDYSILVKWSFPIWVQLEAAIPNFTIHEHHVYNRYDYNKKLCKYDYQPVDGYITVPDLPGIGNELTDYCFTNGKVTTIE